MPIASNNPSTTEGLTSVHKSILHYHQKPRGFPIVLSQKPCCEIRQNTLLPKRHHTNDVREAGMLSSVLVCGEQFL